MKNVLVTGCLGTIGIKTINYLLENTDYNIIGVDTCISNPYIRINEINNINNRFTPIPVQHRHRKIFSGGFHCFILDILRGEN